MMEDGMRFLRLEADYVCDDWSPRGNTSSENDTDFERITKDTRFHPSVGGPM